MTHTKEPWQVNGCRGKIIEDKHKYVYHGIGPDGEEVAGVWFDEKTGLGFKDAHRIVAAVNACTDIPNPAAIADVVDALRGAVPPVGDNPNIPDDEIVPVDMTMGEIRKMQAALAELDEKS